MKKIFMILLLVPASLWISSCSNPANVKIVGFGNVQNDAGLYVVEVNNVKYAPDRIYTGMSNTRFGKETMPPVEGMKVTCFTMNLEPAVYFIAGEYEEAYLEEYFTKDFTVLIIFCFVLFLFCIVLLILGISSKKSSAKKKV